MSARGSTMPSSSPTTTTEPRLSMGGVAASASVPGLVPMTAGTDVAPMKLGKSMMSRRSGLWTAWRVRRGVRRMW